MEISSEQGWTYSACRVDLIFFRRLLMRLIWALVSFMIVSICLSRRGTMACFLEGPLVVIWIFLPLLIGLSSTVLWISMIFLLGKASFIFRIFAADAVTCAND